MNNHYRVYTFEGNRHNTNDRFETNVTQINLISQLD